MVTYHDLHGKNSFPCGVIGTNQHSSVMSCGFHELVFLLLFRCFSLPSLLSSALHCLGKVSANSLHLLEMGACILNLKRPWNPHRGRSICKVTLADKWTEPELTLKKTHGPRPKGLLWIWEEVTPQSKKCRNAHPPVLGRVCAPISGWELNPTITAHTSPICQQRTEYI